MWQQQRGSPRLDLPVTPAAEVCAALLGRMGSLAAPAELLRGLEDLRTHVVIDSAVGLKHALSQTGRFCWHHSLDLRGRYENFPVVVHRIGDGSSPWWEALNTYSSRRDRDARTSGEVGRVVRGSW